ncbi:FadR/GntR family transcriptional regulator [Luteipulveratus halotolerans]|uniref:GntR family transcriptional regulator n=1 Tax=Luteipulveratus halotolerans TaxID=1631356 RepID=A0A0L6CK28_9MICO|nr:FCD domain-containing protein [Luteipulveratus halotolerans]KNX38166.1 GntR family transcriptional regulator [Luteipulveratus halotolerans]
MAAVTTRPRSAQSEVTERIKAYILDHHLHAGDAMPTEAELMEAIGASRSSVREAIKTLSALDIVEVRHGHGTFVGRLSMSAMVESLAFRSLLSSSSDYTVLADLVSVRQMLEQGLATHIIESFTPEQERGLSALAHSMRDLAEQGKPYIEQDREFHLLLLEPLGNELVVQLTGAFWEVQSRVAPSLAVTEESWLRTANAHIEIVSATAARDLDRLHAAIEEHYAPVKEHIRLLAQ